MTPVNAQHWHCSIGGTAMSNEVYANMMEVSCKAASGKSICAFPDVCWTPAPDARDTNGRPHSLSEYRNGVRLH
jgi:hypothetical protein